MVDMNDTTLALALAPHSDYFVATSADWSAFSDGYADAFDDLLEAGDGLPQAVPVPASSRAPGGRSVAPRRFRSERSRPLALAF